MSLHRVSINYCCNFNNSPQFYFLRYLQLVCFIVKGNDSSLRRCFSILLHVDHQYSIFCHVLANISTVTVSSASIIRCCKSLTYPTLVQ